MKKEKLKEPKYFNTWLTRILINNAINLINKKMISLVDNLSNTESIRKETNIEDKLDIISAIDNLEDKYNQLKLLQKKQRLR